jgi:hypothetical protein
MFQTWGSISDSFDLFHGAEEAIFLATGDFEPKPSCKNAASPRGPATQFDSQLRGLPIRVRNAEICWHPCLSLVLAAKKRKNPRTELEKSSNEKLSPVTSAYPDNTIEQIVRKAAYFKHDGVELRPRRKVSI